MKVRNHQKILHKVTTSLTEFTYSVFKNARIELDNAIQHQNQ